ncbi:LysR substrate-binding domain-containing protein [Thalassococcus sp. BH17M4-6]|uniref:LysR substrate-binding domain-containing protein n=1 Tax=Thalassococcus sp. BH17M4-6 TaxID=3413148 RepID=UPI003BCB99D2
MGLDWTNLPSLTALRAFEVAAGSESLSAAARALNVTPAAVNQQIKALEQHLGTELMVRSPRGAVLTPDGEVLADRLREGFARIAGGVEALQARTAERPVRITTTSFFAEAVIFPRIASYWRDNPGDELSFFPSDWAVDLVGEGFDMAVRAGGGNWPGLTVSLLLKSPTVACAAPALVDDPATDWSRVPWLIPEQDGWEADALRQSGIDPASVLRRDLGDDALEIGAGEAGVGLVLESTVDLRPSLASGRLRIAPVPIRHVSQYFIVTPPWIARPAVHRFSAWLRRVCREVAPLPPAAG